VCEMVRLGSAKAALLSMPPFLLLVMNFTHVCTGSSILKVSYIMRHALKVNHESESLFV
jgi:hypothetical protein